jgi:truncated hemoglobin YjbI
MKINSKVVLSTLFASLSLWACSPATSQSGSKTNTNNPNVSMPVTKPLYERLGGKDAIIAVVDDFVGNVAGDTRINMFFAQTAADPARLAKFKNLLVDQVCEATGGPCTYTGKNMMEAHKGMKISEAQFTALVEDLDKSLDKFKVGDKEQMELLGALGGMKADIVGQ